MTAEKRLVRVTAASLKNNHRYVTACEKAPFALESDEGPGKLHPGECIMAAVIAYPHIVKENGQAARLEGHPRVRVAQIVMDYLAHGWSPEEICNQYSHLHIAEIYAAMTYYHDHRDEIEAEIQDELKELENDRKLAKPSPFYLRMKAAGKL